MEFGSSCFKSEMVAALGDEFMGGMRGGFVKDATFLATMETCGGGGGRAGLTL